jgi:hypothetical protein
MDTKLLADEIADAVIDRYLDVIDLTEEFDFADLTPADLETVAAEAAEVFRLWILGAVAG